jgi:hypothetical protein
MEELVLENKALRHITDSLTNRLHMFEISSQTSTAALAQSIRSIPKSPMLTPETSRKAKSRGELGETSVAGGGGDERVAELEAILRKSDAVARKKEAENAKLRETLKGYRERWEDLKSNARARRQGQGGQAQREPRIAEET